MGSLLFGAVSLAAKVTSCGDPSAVSPGDDLSIVNRFIESVRDGDKTRIAEIMSFPMRRRYPLPSISRDEFIARYEELFDDEFVRVIVSSDSEDCGRVGLRGFQLHDGLVWFGDDGRIWIVNYESEFERQERIRLIELERSRLHESLREYRYPVLEWETCTHRIRIDGLEAGYRYAAWKIARLHDSEPDIVIDNGSYHAEGHGGNHAFYFSSGVYKYVVYVDAKSGTGALEVYRTDLNGYHDVRYKSEDRERLLAAPIVNTGAESRYQALLTRLRNCPDSPGASR